MKITIKREQSPNLFEALPSVSTLREAGAKITIKREQGPNLFEALPSVSTLRDAKHAFLLLSCSFFLFSSGCRNYKAEAPGDTSKVLAEEQISLGGVVAEQLLAFKSVDSAYMSRNSLFTDKIVMLQQQANELKQQKEPVTNGAFDLSWKELKQEITNNFEYLSANDIKAWVSLNDSLLKYSGEVRFADELEKMVYNAPVPEIITEQMIKSFCYSILYDRIYINLLGSSAMDYEHTTGGNVRIIQDTEYPYDGRIKLMVELQDSRYIDLFVRIPEWIDQASVTVKGVRYKVEAGKYSEIPRQWENGDVAEVILEFSPEVLKKEPQSLAFTYGPFILSYLSDQSGINSLNFKNSGRVSATHHAGNAATDTLKFRDDPVKYLTFVTPVGQMPTFTYGGVPGSTLVLQPFFTEQETREKRAIWINTSSGD